jgi:hypothetical protein
MSALTKHGIHSNIQIPPESVGERVHHIVFHAVEVSGFTAPAATVPWDISAPNGLKGFVVAFGAINGSSNYRLDIVLRDDSPVIEFTPALTLNLSSNNVTTTCTVENVSKIFNPAVSISGGNNPNNTLSIDKVGAAYMRFSEGEQQLDPKGLTRFSSPSMALDVKFIESTNSSTTYGKITGTASETFIYNERLVALDIGATSGDSIVKRSNKCAFFQGGFGSVIETSVAIGDSGKTGVVRRWGYYDDSNGLYFEEDEGTLYVVVRSSTSGSIVNTRVAQAQWNRDTLDGENGATNPSAVNLDPTMMNYYFMDLPGSTAGKVRFGIFGPSGRIVCHEFFFGNVLPTNFMRTASLPLTWEIFNKSGSPSPSRMKTLGGTVLNEGFQTPESQLSTTTNATWYLDTPKTFTGTAFTPILTARSGKFLDVGNTIVNRKSTIPQKLLYYVSGGPIVLQVRVGMVLLDAAFVKASPLSPAEIDLTATWPSNAQYQGIPIMTRIYPEGCHVVDPPSSFNIHGSGLTLRSDGNYGLAYTFVVKPVNPADNIEMHVGFDWIDV